MREGVVIVDADGHVMDRPHRCYQKYLPAQYARRSVFFPGPYWDRLQAPNGPLFMEHTDGEFEKRPWDAPLCKAKPSEYMSGPTPSTRS